MGSALSSTGFEEDGTKGRNEMLDPILEKLRDLHVVTPILKSPTGDGTLTDILLRRNPSQSNPDALNPSTTAKLFAMYQEWQRVTAANIAKNQSNTCVAIDKLVKTFLVETWKRRTNVLFDGIDHLLSSCRPKRQVCQDFARKSDPFQKQFASSFVHILVSDVLATLWPCVAKFDNTLTKPSGVSVPEALRKEIIEELGHKIIGVEELSMKLLQRLNYAGRVLESSASHLKSVHVLQVELAEMKQSLAETIRNYEKLCHKVEDMGLHRNNIRPVSISNQTQYGARARTVSPPEMTVETSSEIN